MTSRHRRDDTSGLDFQLPPNVTVSHQLLSTGFAYVFREFQLGELGRLAVESTPTGETRLTSEIAGFPSNPMMQRCREVFEPLCEHLARKLEATRGPVRDAPLPVRVPQPLGKIPREETLSEACGKVVAFLIYADTATNEGLFEDVANLMVTHYVRHNVSTYIIGPDLGGGRRSTARPISSRSGRSAVPWSAYGPVNLIRALKRSSPSIADCPTPHAVRWKRS